MSFSQFTINANVHLDDLTAYNYFLVDASAGSLTITLADASLSDGNYMTIRRVDTVYAHTVTIIGELSQMINGVASILLTTNMEIIPVSLNSNWITPIYEAVSTNTVQPVKTQAGTVALVSGTATVSTTNVRTSSIIMLTPQSVSGILGVMSVGTVVEGTSFAINSSSVTDASTVGWVLFETA